MRLYINGQLADLATGTVIAQTKQVNDLAGLQNRNSSYTNTFQLPKTANNLRIMDFMAVTGNTSAVPYTKVEASLYSSTGDCFINKGRAQVTDGGETFEVAIIDGVIDLFKTIENKNLTDAGLEILEHVKDVATVRGTWNQNLPYRYILADYNGNTGEANGTETTQPRINIDYLVPSVNVAWLWKRVMQENGISYYGNIFNTEDFTNLWMTYPKGLPATGENDRMVLDSDNWLFPELGQGFYKANLVSAEVNELGEGSVAFLKVPRAGIYKINIKGKLFGTGTRGSSQPQDAWIRVAKNAENVSNQSNWNEHYVYTNGRSIFGYTLEGNVQKDFADGLPYGEDIDLVTENPFQLEAGDTITIRIQRATKSRGNYESFILNKNDDNQLDVQLYHVDPATVDFSIAFVDFPLKDFVNEIVQRFGLTIFKNRYDDSYEFLTLNEMVYEGGVNDWSDKFHSKETENYIFGTYAQRNYYRYNYNDKEGSHNDHYFSVANTNLADTKDVFKSKLYSPERVTVTYLNSDTNVYKLWDKEVKENPSANEEPVTYKVLDKRYYLMRAFKETKAITVYSKETNISVPVTNYYRESFSKLTFNDILRDYYQAINAILNRTQVVRVKLLLTESDIANLDLRKKVYIKQLSNYFLINKIENYVPCRLTTVELVRVVYTYS